MKLLMIYCSQFAYNSHKKGLESAEDLSEEQRLENALVGFIHVEEKDQERPKRIEDNLVKNLKWGARKNETKTVVVHSFAHLSESKASPEFTKSLLDKVENRMRNAGFDVAQTPWGYFLNLNIQAPGESLARVFKSF
jgi:hypothetical protein